MVKAERAQTLTWLGFFLTLCGAILFSTKAIIVKKAFAQSDVDPVTLLSLRMLFSLPFYLAVAFIISSHKANVFLTRRQWLYIFCLGILGYYLSSLFDFLGLQYISAGLERLILFLYPTFAVLLNRLFFKVELERNQKLALLLTYLGIGTAFFGEMQFSAAPNFYLGCFLVVLCAITYSFYLVGSSRIIPQVGANKFTAYAMLSSTVGVLAHFGATRPFADLSVSSTVWEYGLMLAIIATVIPSFLLSSGIKKIGANNAAIISSVGPVSTIIQAHYFLGEKIGMPQIIGTAMVIAGILLLGWREKEP